MTALPGGFLGFEGRCVVVTGASSGLGRACAMELSAHGARTLLIGRNEERLAEVLGSLSGSGHQSLVLDLTRLDQIGPEVTRAIAGVGRLYGLCHAAGVVTTRPLHANTCDVVQEMMTVNLVAGLELARIVARRDVMEPDGGSLLFVSSIYGNVGVAGQTAYSASKGAITAAVRSMAVELARRRVRVNTISPGLVKTAMTDRALETLSHQQVMAIEERHPLGPGTPSDVARAAVFLLAPATTWITGIDLVVDGGYSAQ
jgi:NAD(P)-dependent dehydrogenase (short-subunit alcohol dehydrogenase family)